MKKCCFISLWVLLITAVVFPPFAAAGLVDGPDWSIAGTGDFNGGESQGVLWRNQTTGDMAVWYMHGSTLVSEQQLESAPGSAWDVVGLGDFNGDGSPDILLRDASTGDVRIWYLNGSVVVGQDTVARMGSPWNIVGVGDFNGDGSPDIVWRNSATGETIVWYMQGVLRLGTETLETLPPPWNIIEDKRFRPGRVSRHPLEKFRNRRGCGLVHARRGPFGPRRLCRPRASPGHWRSL